MWDGKTTGFVEKHSLCFDAVVVIVQLQLENGMPLFDVQFCDPASMAWCASLFGVEPHCFLLVRIILTGYFVPLDQATCCLVAKWRSLHVKIS